MLKLQSLAKEETGLDRFLFFLNSDDSLNRVTAQKMSCHPSNPWAATGDDRVTAEMMLSPFMSEVFAMTAGVSCA